MDTRYVPLVLAHLFRKLGPEVALEDAVAYLSFRCRYGPPTEIRKLLTVALENEMISRRGDTIVAEFMYDSQYLSPDQPAALEGRVRIGGNVRPMY